MQQAASSSAPSAGFREEVTDDGWVLLGAGGSSDTAAGGRPPRPPRRGGNRPPGAQAPFDFDPAPDDLVGRYLPARRALRCGDLPPQIHDADVYGAHPAFLARVHPPANGARPEWLFFVCRGRGLGGKRRAGPGAYRLTGEAKPSGAWYCHSFRYYEDSAEASDVRETEWLMEEYGDRCPGGARALDVVACKVYPARGGALNRRLRLDGAARRAGADVRPQVLVQLYLASLSAGDPLRCRMHRTADVCAAHPAVLTAVLPPANDQFEWLFVVRRPRTEHHGGDDGTAHPRRAGPGQYVPAARYWAVTDGEGRELGYRRLFRYREDDEQVRRTSRTVWSMEEYGFGPDFPYGEHGGDEELLVYKVYLRMARQQGA
ncbi:hypothetical protein C2845_PM15G13860 [Panicum miliaceum]|uniref:NAC domain-containing protein n=1 Tax=Panicum miliaceum TaxID=4540 RepID=A0A3L6Q835_PANMI|nr:hypothetical protein C2845_PM15G13860 [Panicum miliaceum]